MRNTEPHCPGVRREEPQAARPCLGGQVRSCREGPPEMDEPVIPPALWGHSSPVMSFPVDMTGLVYEVIADPYVALACQA